MLTTALPGLLKEGLPGAQVDVLLHPNRASILAGHPRVDRAIAFDDRWLFLGAFAPGVRRLRRERYDAIVDCTNWTDPSVRSALVCRLAGASSTVIGPAAFPVAPLYSVAVLPRRDTRNELEQRVHLLSPLVPISRPPRLSFRPLRPSEHIQPLLASLRGRPYAVVNPGGRLDWRRLSTSTFAAAAQALTELGIRVVITWGPGEEGLADALAMQAPGAVVAPETNVDNLGALMQLATLTVCNNTGPMHLSVALGTPTLAFFHSMDPQRWGHTYEPHRMVDLTSVPREELDARVRSEVWQFAEQCRVGGALPASVSASAAARRPPT